MKNTDIIKNNYEFKYFLKKGTYIPGKLIEVFLLNTQNINKLGIAVSKKSGNSVQRNQIKRFIRAAYTDLELSFKQNIGVLIIWKKNNKFEYASYKDIKNDLEKILQKKEIL